MENLLELRSDPELDSRSLDESKLFTVDGGVLGGEIAMACWFCAGKRGRADVASGMASRRRRRRKMKSFMVQDRWVERWEKWRLHLLEVTKLGRRKR